ncbi:hypothetical protein FEE95_05060 [Maribacter algarum]|uniref:Uncharacterized protein n=1 Tax=Maribacter algarum (ex Zhang et al. 2020) TaxID=2578118 RepID=A0A5S3PUW6_9FLAO|nr:DUF6638 family protein [Maribacter algarum]TMM58801.1 hypothetical protein FEE95_05060 [Maribacter algarum]
MEKLRAAGLFGGALTTLSGSLAKRYNECLAMLGVTPTKLKTFSIDGMGWSPEVAVEKKDNYYLNTGEANVNAIIISPQQENKPVHMPSHSFDRDVMEAVFAAYGREIRDITKDSALVLHLDQKIDAFFEPFDLLRYDKIEVTFALLNDLDKKQMEQQAFINFFNRDNNFIDRDVHNHLLNSAKEYGDLRGRRLKLEPIQLKVSSFYTRAFGGVFVLKNFVKKILIFEDEKMFKSAINDSAHEVMLFHKDHDELMDALVSNLVLRKDFKGAMRSQRYDRIKKHVFVEETKKTEHPLSEILDSHFLFKKYLNKLPKEVQKRISGVELYYQRLIVDKNLKLQEYVDPHFVKVLHEPHPSLKEEEEELAWKLLSKIVPKDPVHLFWYDKEQFYRVYSEWKPDYQDWVIEEILENNQKQGM